MGGLRAGKGGGGGMVGRGKGSGGGAGGVIIRKERKSGEKKRN